MTSSRTPFCSATTGQSLSRRAFTATALAGAAALALALALALPAHAQQYPTKPIRLVVPFGAGDPPDIYARLLAERVSPLLGQQIIIDNKAGAAGAIGAAEVAKAPADGYTLLLASAAMMGIVPQLRKTPYDPVKDFEPVARVVSTVLMVSVNKDFPANTWPEFVAEAKRQPGKYSVISSGEGSLLQFSAVQLMDAAGIQLLHVPYKSFGQGVTDLAAGQVNVMMDPTAALPFIKSGAMKALLVLDDKPSRELPEVPTLKQYPIPFTLKAWFGVVAPAGTPRPVIDRLQAAIGKIVNDDPAYRDRLGAGSTPSFSGGRDFATFLEQDRNAYGGMIKKLNLKLD